ncbi:MAG: CBS domain-containing protein [Myxococcales bacterium]|nr:CBS domain-containing protein [Myxococcales bacterium]
MKSRGSGMALDSLCQAMLISDLMTTALVTARPEDKVDSTLYDMKLAMIRHLPVVDDRGHLVGIVSDRDVLLSLGTSEATNVYLRDIMSRDVETVSEDEDAASALEIILEKRIGSLPVVGEEGQLLGVVTETDYLRVAHSMLSSKSVSSEESWRD